MKQVMHQVSMHRSYVTTEAMTTAHVQVLCIFKLQTTQIYTVAIQLITTLSLVVTCVSLVLNMWYAGVMASVVTYYVQCIDTWCMTYSLLFDDLSGHSYPSTFMIFFYISTFGGVPL